MKKKLIALLLTLSLTLVASVTVFGIEEGKPLPIPTSIIIHCIDLEQ